MCFIGMASEVGERPPMARVGVECLMSVSVTAKNCVYRRGAVSVWGPRRRMIKATSAWKPLWVGGCICAPWETLAAVRSGARG